MHADVTTLRRNHRFMGAQNRLDDDGIALGAATDKVDGRLWGIQVLVDMRCGL